MSRVDDLLKKWCPDGVDFKRLGDIATLSNTGVDKKIIPGETEVSLLNYMDICRKNRISQASLSATTSASPKKIVECNLLKGDVFITPSSETRDDLANAAEVVSDIPNAVYSYHIMRIRMHNFSQMNPTFAVHLFSSKLIQEQIIRLSTGMTRYGLTKPKWESLKFPVPPLEIQLEIARILDGYIELGVELKSQLEAELQARKFQYDFYRDQLLGFGNESLKWVRFGDVATILRGASPRPIQNFITESVDGVPWIKIGDTTPGEKYVTSTRQRITDKGAKNSRLISPGDFILSNSMSFGRPYISKIHGCIHDGWLAISDFENNIDSDYLYHVLQSHAMQLEFSQRASSGTVSNLNADIVKSVQIPLPPIEQQIQIARALNEFESILSGTVQVLPAEIEARQKQYEYYRNKLLTFKELEVA